MYVCVCVCVLACVDLHTMCKSGYCNCVGQATHVLIQDLRLTSRISDLDLLALLLAMGIHNFRHPGVRSVPVALSTDAILHNAHAHECTPDFVCLINVCSTAVY